MPPVTPPAAMVRRTKPHRFGDLAKSSDAYARLVVDHALATTSANYYDCSATVIPSSDLSYDEANARELWGERASLRAVVVRGELLKPDFE